jgi:hypothetical protein
MHLASRLHLEPAECGHLIKLAEPDLERSGVVETEKDGIGVSITHRIRTSSGAFVNRGQDAIIRGV